MLSGPQKGPAERGHFKKRQKVSNIFFDTFRHVSRAAKSQSRSLGRGCDEAPFSEKKGFSVRRGEAIQ